MGQPRKGTRGYIPLRPPVDQLAVYQQRADELGIALGSYSVMRMAEAEGLDVPDWVLDEIERAKKKRADEAERAAEERARQQIAGLEELPEQKPGHPAVLPRKERPLARSA